MDWWLRYIFIYNPKNTVHYSLRFHRRSTYYKKWKVIGKNKGVLVPQGDYTLKTKLRVKKNLATKTTFRANPLTYFSVLLLLYISKKSSIYLYICLSKKLHLRVELDCHIGTTTGYSKSRVCTVYVSLPFLKMWEVRKNLKRIASWNSVWLLDMSAWAIRHQCRFRDTFRGQFRLQLLHRHWTM